MTPSALEALAGEYRSDELDATYTLAVEQGSLMLRNRSRSPLKLKPLSSNEFQAEDLGTLVFNTDDKHRVSGFTLNSQGARGIDFKKVGP